MDRGAWWATVHRVAQSQTRMKQLSMLAQMVWAGAQASVEIKSIPGDCNTEQALNVTV